MKTKEQLFKEFGNLALVESTYFDDPNLTDEENMKLACSAVGKANSVKPNSFTQEQEEKLEQEMKEMMARLEPVETPSEEEIKRIWNTRNNLTFIPNKV